MRTRLAFVFVVLSFFGNAFAQSTPPALVSRIAGAFDGAVVAFERGVARSRFVDVNTAVLNEILADLRTSPGVIKEVGIEFFPDRTFVIQLTGAENIGGTVSYTGHVKGLPELNATIIQNGDVVAANVAAFGRIYQIRFSGSGHEVREFDPSELKDHDEAKLLAINAPATKRSMLDTAMLDDGSTIDVMVVWTPASRALRGGVSGMQALVALGIAETNTAYANSGVIQRLRLVYSGEVAFTETDFNTDLNSLTGTTDGLIDEVHSIRNAVGADFVSLWGEYSSACGVGWFMQTESSGFASNAFNVVASSCATGNYSFGHELGHNMGLRHDPFVDSTVNSTIDAVLVPYAHGYVDTANHMRTIMAYNDQCAALAFNCTRMQRFGNAGLNMTSPFNSVSAPSGTLATWPGPTPPANGSTSNEFLALNGTRDTTANFRQSVDQQGVTFSRSSTTVSEAAGSVVFTVLRLAGATGAASVNWATTPVTAVPGTQYTTASGTLNWAAGDTSAKTITVTILQNTLAQLDTSFTVNLSSPTGAVLGSFPTTTVLIKDDEDTFPAGACAIPAGFTQAAGNVVPFGTATDSTYQGACALASTEFGSAIGNSGIEYIATLPAGNVTFKYRVSSATSNPFYGKMEFLIDGAVRLTDQGGLGGWESFTTPVTAGAHTLTWRYVKFFPRCSTFSSPVTDEGSACADKLWIDDVVIPSSFTLTVAKSGTGVGTVTSTTPAGGISCGIDCTEPYSSGTSVTLAAAAGTNSIFAGWSGACTGTGSCVVSMTQARSVTATFTRIDRYSDWNADGKPDIIWSNTANGNTYLWYMNGPVLATDAFLAGIDPSWKIQGVGDFNGDGKPDLVWRNTANGNTYVWYMNGSSFISDAFVFALPPEWVIQGVADFNGDGKPDFLMRNSVTGNAFVWFFNNVTDVGSQFLFNIDPSWKVEGVGDMNGDGQPDLLFRNTVTGLSFAWFTQYSASTLSLAGSTPALFGIDPAWEIVQVADWNGDGSPDFLFRNRNTGVVFVWYVNGTTLAGSDFITQIDPSWEIVPRH